MTHTKAPPALHPGNRAVFTRTERSQSARAMTTDRGRRAPASHRSKAGGQEGTALPFFHPPGNFPGDDGGVPEPKPRPPAPKSPSQLAAPPSHPPRGETESRPRRHRPPSPRSGTPPVPPKVEMQPVLPERGTLPLPHSHVVHSFGEGGISAAHGHSCGHKEEQPETEDD